MKNILRIILVQLFITACNVLPPLHAQPLERGSSVCSPKDELFSIRKHVDDSVTICGSSEPEECHNDHYLPAYEYSHPDLNGDGLSDFVIRRFDGMSGDIHSLSYFVIFVACTPGIYRRVHWNAYASINIDAGKSEGCFAVLRVVRDCFSMGINSEQRREYEIRYNIGSREYGPPADDPRLQDYCSDYEMSLPWKPAVTEPMPRHN